jgi:hypothetical protein
MKHLRKFNESVEMPKSQSDDIGFSISDWWISIDEYLPQNGQTVIVYLGGRGKGTINIVIFEKSVSKQEKEEYIWKIQGHRSFVSPGTYFGQEVTHWMPIPGNPEGYENPDTSGGVNFIR